MEVFGHLSESEEMWKFIVPEDVFKSINQEFLVESLSIKRRSPIFYVKSPTDVTNAISRLRIKLKDLGYLPYLSKRGDRLAITLVHKPKHKPERMIWNLLLFLAQFIDSFVVILYTQALKFSGRFNFRKLFIILIQAC